MWLDVNWVYWFYNDNKQTNEKKKSSRNMVGLFAQNLYINLFLMWKVKQSWFYLNKKIKAKEKEQTTFKWKICNPSKIVK